MQSKKITRCAIKNIFGPSLQDVINKFSNESKNFNSILYHYTKFKNLEKILASRKLILSHYKNLNDDMEIKHAITLSLQTILGYAKCSRYSHFWNYFCNVFNSIHVIDFYVCSFSDIYNNKYLWKNYAEDFHGVCLGFRPEYFRPVNQIKKKNKKLISLEKIHYDETGFSCYIRKIIAVIESKLQDYIHDLDNNNLNIYAYLASEVAIFIFPLLPKLKKNIGNNNQLWEKENEWRIYQIAYTKKFNATLSGHDHLDKPRMGKARISLGLNDICEIWIGSSCSDNEIKEVKKLVEKYKFKDVKIKKLKKDSVGSVSAY